MLGKVYDLAIIGGGINGTAIARDAAGRGLSVFLCDEGDLGAGSSSATTKVVHGGLRLMEGFQLGAMRELVVEREILMRTAPHLVRPLRFHIPHHARQWSTGALSLGLFVFDHVAHSSLPAAERVDVEHADAACALHPHFTTAFAYSDCLADDSRLVILNAIDARQQGASIHPRVRCTVAERDGGQWRLSLESTPTGEPTTLLAGILVNAAGAAAGAVHNHVVHARGLAGVRMAKGSHIVVRRDSVGEVGYALPNADGRIVFALPFRPGLMLIGPAVADYAGDPGAAKVERGDAAYLLDVANQYFETPVEAADIAWSFACVRALPTAPGLVRRGRAVVVDAPPRLAPLISVFGGTLVTHRRLAGEVVDRMGKFRKLSPSWTEGEVLPGGGFPPDGATDLARALTAAYPFVAESHGRRLVATYGTRASAILLGKRGEADLGRRFVGDLTAAEVDFLRHDEWAMTAEDILWRRTKFGLEATAAEAEALSAWLAERPLPPVPIA